MSCDCSIPTLHFKRSVHLLKNKVLAKSSFVKELLGVVL